MHQPGVGRGELAEQELPVLVGADPSDHGGRVAEPRERVDRVGGLAAAGAHRVDVREASSTALRTAASIICSVPGGPSSSQSGNVRGSR